ncbi:MAG: hypothetical protein VYB54_02365 [Pseudomonadota bacterium]|nr:hypothetical protein [Pseudomonadota bacterium]
MHHALPAEPLLGFPVPAANRPWIVVFVDPPEPAPDAPWPNRLLSRLLKLLHPGFRHVLALSPEGPGRDWLVVNPGGLGLGIGIARGDATLPTLRRLVASGDARAVIVSARAPDRFRPRGLLTCVSTIGHLTGVPTGPFTTPRAFHKRLLANGGHAAGSA